MTSLAINTDDLFTQIEIDPATTHTPAGSLPSIVYKQHGQTEIQSWLFPQLTNKSFHLEINVHH